jgi:hypothetical protein
LAASDRQPRAPHVFVCAWCQRTLGNPPRVADAVKNYGMCRRCLEVRLLALRTRDGKAPARVTARAVGDP